jgi:hypothetical protein
MRLPGLRDASMRTSSPLFAPRSLPGSGRASASGSGRASPLKGPWIDAPKLSVLESLEASGKECEQNSHLATLYAFVLYSLGMPLSNITHMTGSRDVSTRRIDKTRSPHCALRSLPGSGRASPSKGSPAKCSRVAIAMDSPSLSKRVLSISLPTPVEEPLQPRSPSVPLIELTALIDVPEAGTSIHAPKLSVLESLEARGKKCTQNRRTLYA